MKVSSNLCRYEAAKWIESDESDTLKKEWSCERWVQIDTGGELENNQHLLIEYANNIDLHIRAFENNKDLQNPERRVLFSAFSAYYRQIDIKQI